MTVSFYNSLEESPEMEGFLAQENSIDKIYKPQNSPN